ncbi:hypothetical protein KGA66_03500 [Actinocrinis puniceicyclus]|uniref:Uncharacterized protein n=1 Tax=Actinocrinis puniceicyclus TaxID=977794 RepID=A0A8J7WLS2_9ACTN|nr:hypothetical protein [Actinocrinis puniceicyclus]MBS2962099.1 hypothetical protein [Actinocrinis puniceicyclus]
MTAPTCALQLPLFAETTGGPEDRIPSDGLTLDTPAGPVDLVAVQRALDGERLHLTRAEHRYIAAQVRAHLTVRPANRKEVAR